ncbi:MAG: Ku protein [Candidatus Dormibacteraceae bacterium]
MPRSSWRGSVSFGLVSIPVRLYPATESKSAGFRQLCRDHEARIQYKRWCPVGDHEVPYGDIAHGFEVARDEYVLIEDEDLDNLPLPTAHAIEIQEFVPAAEIPAGLYYKAPYYVEPDEAGRKPYHLLMKALRETGRGALAKIALRDREHLCVVQPLDGLLLLNTLNWPEEIRSTEGLKSLEEGAVKVDGRELKMAMSLVESLAGSFDPSRYKDDYREALGHVVEAKMKGQAPVRAAEAPAEGKVMDLMEALRASVDAARKERPQRRAGASRNSSGTAHRKAS